MHKDFLFERELPAVELPDKQILLYNFRTKEFAILENSINSEKTLEALANYGFILNPKPYIQAPEEGIAKLVFILTNKCNLNCKYCYNDCPSRKFIL